MRKNNGIHHLDYIVYRAESWANKTKLCAWIDAIRDKGENIMLFVIWVNCTFNNNPVLFPHLRLQSPHGLVSLSSPPSLPEFPLMFNCNRLPPPPSATFVLCSSSSCVPRFVPHQRHQCHLSCPLSARSPISELLCSD